MSNNRCQVLVGDAPWCRPCNNPAKVEYNGVHYCGVHDPHRLDALREKAMARERARKQPDLDLAAAMNREKAAQLAVIEQAYKVRSVALFPGVPNELSLMIEAYQARDIALFPGLPNELFVRIEARQMRALSKALDDLSHAKSEVLAATIRRTERRKELHKQEDEVRQAKLARKSGREVAP